MNNKGKIVAVLVLMIFLMSSLTVCCTSYSEGATEPTVSYMKYCGDTSKNVTVGINDPKYDSMLVEFQESSSYKPISEFVNVKNSMMQFQYDETVGHYMPLRAGGCNVTIGLDSDTLLDTYPTDIYSVSLASGTVKYDRERSFLISADSLPDYKLDPYCMWNTQPDGTGTAVTTLTESLFLRSHSVTLYASDASGFTLELDPHLLVIKKDGTGTISAVFNPESSARELEWSISDDSIASMQVASNKMSATFTGLKDGETKVTVTANGDDGKKITATARLIVGIPVEDIELDKTEADIGIYQTLTLHATIHPNNATVKDVTWISSDENVAVVHGDGLSATVTGVGEGVATITVITDDGGFTAECVITVVNNIIPAETETGILTPEQEEEIIADIEEMRGQHPDITPTVDIYTKKEFLQCTTDFLIRATDEELDATLKIDFPNGSSIVMVGASVRSMDLPNDSTFKIICEKQNVQGEKIMAEFEIHIEIDGKITEMKFSPDVAVFLPYKLASGQELKYLKVVCAETGEEFEYEYINDIGDEGVLFYTGHFSHYRVIYESQPTPSDKGFPIWAIILIIIIILIT